MLAGAEASGLASGVNREANRVTRGEGAVQAGVTSRTQGVAGRDASESAAPPAVLGRSRRLL